MEYPKQLYRGEVPQAERAEDGEWFSAWGRGCLRGKRGVFVKCLCCLMIRMSARFEYGTHADERTHV